MSLPNSLPISESVQLLTNQEVEECKKMKESDHPKDQSDHPKEETTKALFNKISSENGTYRGKFYSDTPDVGGMIQFNNDKENHSCDIMLSYTSKFSLGEYKSFQVPIETSMGFYRMFTSYPIDYSIEKFKISIDKIVDSSTSSTIYGRYECTSFPKDSGKFSVVNIDHALA